MPSTLPSRWQEILRREAADKVGSVLAQAQNQAEPRRVPRWSVPALVIAVASLSLMSLLGDTEARGRGAVPFGRSTLISTRTAGLAADAEDLAPRKPRPTDTAVATLPPPETKPRPAVSSAVQRKAPTPSPRCVDCDKRTPVEAASPSPEPTEQPEAPAIAVPEKPAPVTINVGTRLQAVLTEPLITGAALAPASAKLAADFHVGDRIALPAGTTLVGEGFATHQDDRVQVVFTAFVKDGKTIPLEAWALQQSEMGIQGKVIRKGSKAKKGTGTLLGAAASALTYGLASAAGGPGGAALANLGSTAGSDLSGLGRDWRLSDKAVRVEGGVPITVYLRRDLTIE